ncbi:hypothetical protein PBI_MARYV_158 [Mycobacterium phage MaryV]|uniref:Uncharacterized protein n=1 Tax=Mycobacterium phage MaryV TaxID=2656593 RepID=A0A649VCG6_9CAUD|nr:hypothetical protein PBI_MARYV_158 [Mycobacterium phage MaryV]
MHVAGTSHPRHIAWSECVVCWLECFWANLELAIVATIHLHL